MEPTLFQDIKVQPQVQALDYNQLAIEVLRQIRGDLSQRDLSQKLGFSYNQVGKWESLATQIKWDDFLHLAKSLNIPVEKHFREYFFWALEEEFSPALCLRVLSLYMNSRPIGWKRPKSLIDKWMNGSSVPDLSEVLMMMDSKPWILIDWLSRFIDCSKISSLAQEYKKTLAVLDLYFEVPSCSMVNAALQLQSYQMLDAHDENLIAQETSCSHEEIRKALAVMLQSGTVIFEQGKYHSFFTEPSFLRHPKGRMVTQYVTGLAAKRFSTLTPPKVNLTNPSVSAVRVAAMSSQASKKILDLMVKFHNDCSQVLKDDKEPKDHVRLMVLHNFAANLYAPEKENDKSPTGG
ncbi:MAG: helix-turn-helix domain-containing protein [Pseudobdellovibrionaceae bacterium]